MFDATAPPKHLINSAFEAKCLSHMKRRERTNLSWSSRIAAHRTRRRPEAAPRSGGVGADGSSRMINKTDGACDGGGGVSSEQPSLASSCAPSTSDKRVPRALSTALRSASLLRDGGVPSGGLMGGGSLPPYDDGSDPDLFSHWVQWILLHLMVRGRFKHLEMISKSSCADNGDWYPACCPALLG